MAEHSLAEVGDIIGRHGREAGELIPILQEAQRVYGYLSEAAMRQIADALGVPLGKVYAVASFYSLFALAPKGKHIIRLCESGPCHVRGVEGILKAIENELGVAPGQTTADGLFTLEHTSCLGACGRAPVMMAGDVLYEDLTPAKVKEIIARYRQAAPAAGE